MIKIAVFLLILFNANIALAGCLSASQLLQLADKETRYLSQQVPPAFKHALADKTVLLAVEAVAGDGCQAQLVLTLPQDEIDEASAILEAQPAKKIMLSAQGYALPQEPINKALFTVAPDSLAIAGADILQTAPLGNLRASVELMYAFITQKRANLSATQTNAVPWPEALNKQVVASCQAQAKSVDCGCMAAQYALTIPARQMTYILANQQNPYALAAGANQGFKAVKQSAMVECKG